jgi:hypothetical protein
MRINKASEAILAKYAAPEKKLRVEPLHKTQSASKKGASIQDFYEEILSKNPYLIDQVYNGKNAQEIESMMMQNRKLIETSHMSRY